MTLFQTNHPIKILEGNQHYRHLALKKKNTWTSTIIQTPDLKSFYHVFLHHFLPLHLPLHHSFLFKKRVHTFDLHCPQHSNLFKRVCMIDSTPQNTPITHFIDKTVATFIQTIDLASKLLITQPSTYLNSNHFSP